MLKIKFTAICDKCKKSAYEEETSDINYKVSTNFVKDARRFGWAVSYLRNKGWVFCCPDCRNYNYVRDKKSFDALYGD